MNPFDYRQVQWAAIRALLVFSLWVGCLRCRVVNAEKLAQGLAHDHGGEVARGDVCSRIKTNGRDKALAEVRLLREQRRLGSKCVRVRSWPQGYRDREVEGSKARSHLQSGRSQPAQGIAATAICATVLISREVVR